MTTCIGSLVPESRINLSVTIVIGKYGSNEVETRPLVCLNLGLLCFATKDLNWRTAPRRVRATCVSIIKESVTGTIFPGANDVMGCACASNPVVKSSNSYKDVILATSKS